MYTGVNYVRFTAAGQERFFISNTAINFGRVASGTSYAFPLTRGTVDQQLVTNGAGVVTWQHPIYPVAHYIKTASQNVSLAGGQTQITWQTTVVQRGIILVGAVNAEVDRAGVYSISYEYAWSTSNSGTVRTSWIAINDAIGPANRRYGKCTVTANNTGPQSGCGSAILRLNALDMISIYVECDANVTILFNPGFASVSEQVDFQITWTGGF
jgi:hypothetical protein